jgi:oxygen-independent coproporphyrinogen III oxidase
MIYLHIPFCEQKCSYCNFHFSTQLQHTEAFVAALLQEIELQKNHWSFSAGQSIYFGGGTPSLLSLDQLARIFEVLQTHFPWQKDAEITLEANPNNLDEAYLRGLKALGVNRLSIGTQSFFEEDLKLMQRSHKAHQAEASVKMAQDIGFDNISIDLIYGAPTAQTDTWAKNLQKAVDLQVQHISSYALTVEAKTLLAHWVAKGQVPMPNEGQQSQDFAHMQSFLQENGFEHYEISNFAKPNYRSRHNTAYWQGKPYLGLGPSAHSYNGHECRSWNVANNQQYIAEIAEGKIPNTQEILSPENQYNERVMIGLRSVFGVSLADLRQHCDVRTMAYFLQQVGPYVAAGQMILEDELYRIKPEYWFLADGIAADLFLV